MWLSLCHAMMPLKAGWFKFSIGINTLHQLMALKLQTFQSLIYSKCGLMSSRKAAELCAACAVNICLKCKVVRDDEWQRQSCLCIMYGKKTQTSISIKWAPLEKCMLDSISLKTGCMVKGSELKQNPSWLPAEKALDGLPLHANACEVLIFPSCQDHSAAPNSFPSLSQLAFGPGNDVDRHLPICLSVASFHRTTSIWRGCVVGGNEWESKQANDG